MSEPDDERSRDERFMELALEQARRGIGRTWPNPAVGCIIALDGEVVGAGYHPKAGEPHAEVMALESVPDRVDTSRCVLYVTLEPCCMQGRTPACTSAVQAAGIRRVVVGTIDPDRRVHGRGIALMRERGVEVKVGVLQGECRHLIRGFAKRVSLGLPWVVAKWAMSLDGKIAARDGSSFWITGEHARRRAHRLRDELDAVLVGKGTALADDPRLTCRLEGGRDPARVLIDARLEVGLDLKLLDPSTSRGETFIIALKSAPQRAIRARRERGLHVLTVDASPASPGRVAMRSALAALAERGLGTVMVEGGAGVLGAMWDAGLIDEVCAFVAPKIIAGEGAPSPVGGLGAGSMAQVERLERARAVALEGGDVEIRGELPPGSRREVVRW